MSRPLACVPLRVLCLVLGLGLPPHALAQEPPFQAEVYEDQVTIRSGAGRAYYSVGVLKKGDVVTVEDVFHGWNKIKPPEGVYSYISKGFVNAQGDGSTGVVNRDRAEVKAANVKGPGQSYRGQVELGEGDMVTIIEEEGSYYKVTPPRGAYVFLEPGSVRRVTTLPPAEPVKPKQPEPTQALEPKQPIQPEPPKPAEPQEPRQPEQPKEPAPAEPKEPRPPKPPKQPEQPKQPAPAEPAEPKQPIEPQAADATDSPATAGNTSPDEIRMDKGDSLAASDLDSSDLATLDAQMLPLFEKPLEEQPIDQMIEAYRKFQNDPDLSPTDQRIVRLRLAALQHNQNVLAAIQETDKTLAQIQTAREEQERIDANTFKAVGILRASSVYDGKNLPKMYRLVDPTTQRTKAYVTPSGAYDPTKLLGQLVGVQGSETYDEGAKLTVIEPTRVTALEAGE